MKKEKDFWNNVAQKYDAQVMKKYSKTYDDTIQKSVEYLNSSDVVLELACGTGIITLKIAGHVKKIYAVDLSQGMIDAAKQKAKAQGIDNIEFSVAAVEELNYPPESFDTVTAFNLLCFLRDGEQAIAKIYEMLKPGGMFLSATDCMGENKNIKSVLLSLFVKMGLVPYFKQYKTDALVSVIKRNGFDVIDAENLYDTPPNYFIAAKKQ